MIYSKQKKRIIKLDMKLSQTKIYYDKAEYALF